MSSRKTILGTGRRLGLVAVLAHGLVAGLALGLVAGLAHANENDEAKSPASGVRAELLGQLQEAREKLVELAEAMPARRYTWRPGKGVRSVAEVYLHVAQANYLMPSMMGAVPPEGIDPMTLEKSTTSKPRVVQHLKDSFAHAEKALGDVSDADLNKKVRIFDHEGTVREAQIMLVAHAHEHLGQSIAYARINGIVPPWTARDQSAQRGAGGP